MWGNGEIFCVIFLRCIPCSHVGSHWIQFNAHTPYSLGVVISDVEHENGFPETPLAGTVKMSNYINLHKNVYCRFVHHNWTILQNKQI